MRVRPRAVAIGLNEGVLQGVCVCACVRACVCVWVRVRVCVVCHGVRACGSMYL